MRFHSSSEKGMKGNGTWELRNHNGAAEVVKCGFLDSYAWNPKIQLDDQCSWRVPREIFGHNRSKP